MHAAPNNALPLALSAWGLSLDPHNKLAASLTTINRSPPLLRIANFLTASQCDALIALQAAATSESDLYLNYRVNRELSSSAISREAARLIAEFPLARDALRPSMRSGFRAQIPPDAPQLRPVLRAVSDALGFAGRDFVFAEGQWIRPTRRTVVVRDQTTVQYRVGEGVAPHVDGKDLTVLVCLHAPEDGGRTVFPEDGVAVKPEKGAAIVYRSKDALLHFAEPVHAGTKWVMQLLIDYNVRPDEIDVDYQTGTVFS